MIQFKDCPHCGKRIRLDATRCHRCHREVWREDTFTNDTDETSYEHLAAGGYSDDDDFDYDRFVNEEFKAGRRKLNPLWYWLALIVLIVSLAAIVYRH